MFYVASRLRNDLKLPFSIGRPLLDRYNARLAEHGEEPWTSKELDHKWNDAGKDKPKTCSAELTLHKPANDPHRLAHEFKATRPWVYWHGMYFEYDGTKYVEVPDTEVLARLNGHIKERLDADFELQLIEDTLRSNHYSRRAMRRSAPLSVSTSLTRNTLQALESLTLKQIFPR